MSFLQRFAGKLDVFFSSPQWARFGGVSLVVAGAIGLATIILLFILSSRERVATAYPGSGYAWMENALSVLWPANEIFIFFGLVGIFSLIRGMSSRLRWMALAGVALAGLSAASWPLYWLSVWLSGHPDTYVYSMSELFNSLTFFFLVNWSGPVGIFLLGVAAMKVRGLGVFRFLPISIGVLSMPFVPSILFRVFSGGETQTMEPTMWTTVLVALPILLASLGWIAVGIMLLGAKEREARIFAKENRETEERNLALARRLYDEAWGREELSVVDEIISDDFFDKRRKREGAAAFKQAISDLHVTFPDLETSVTEQTSEGDEVSTLITFSGTDEGGVLYYPPTHGTATFAGAFTDRFDGDGKLTEHDGELDEESLMEQLGHPSEK